jgi:hypothetical protein
MFIMSGLASILNKKLSYACKQKSQSSGDYLVFDRKSDRIVVIGLIPGSGSQSNEGFVVVPAVGIFLSCTDFASCFCVFLRSNSNPIVVVSFWCVVCLNRHRGRTLVKS